MQIRKKHLLIGGLITAGICLLLAIGLVVYWLFFYEEEVPEPVYATPISADLSATEIQEIRVTNETEGYVYTFDSETEMNALLDALREVRLYRENVTGVGERGDSLKATLVFEETETVDFYLTDGFCTNSNGTRYDCANTEEDFFQTFEKQVEMELYGKRETVE